MLLSIIHSWCTMLINKLYLFLILHMELNKTLIGSKIVKAFYKIFINMNFATINI